MKAGIFARSMVLDISSGTSTTRRLMGELVGVPITTPNSIRPLRLSRCSGSPWGIPPLSLHGPAVAAMRPLQEPFIRPMVSAVRHRTWRPTSGQPIQVLMTSIEGNPCKTGHASDHIWHGL